MFIVHPKVPRGPHVTRDFALMTHEWRIEPGAGRAPGDPLDPTVWYQHPRGTVAGRADPARPLADGIDVGRCERE